MAAPTTIGAPHWNVRAGGSDLNGGGFDPWMGTTKYAADLVATVATSNSPVVTSASYNFVAGDIGAYLYIGSGTSWATGWYKIISVSGGAATINGTIGSATRYHGVNNVATAVNGFVSGTSTITGCATVASPTSGSWAIDYSQQDAAQFAYTDLVISGSNNKQMTSASHPFTVAQVGNFVNITGGVGFTVQRVEIETVSAGVATVGDALGTLSLTGGTGNMGGAFQVPSTVITSAALMAIAGNTVWIKSNVTETRTTAITLPNISGGSSLGSGGSIAVRGFDIIHGDLTGNRPLLTSATNSCDLIRSTSSAAQSMWLFDNIRATHTATTRGNFIGGDGAGLRSMQFWRVENCVVDGCYSAFFGAGTDTNESPSSSCVFFNNEIKNCTYSGLRLTTANVIGCDIHDCVGSTTDGIAFSGNVTLVGNILTGNGRSGMRALANMSGNMVFIGNVVANNGGDGFNTILVLNNSAMFHINNLYYGNGGYGWSPKSATEMPMINDYNAYGSNTSGSRNLPGYAGSHDITLTADPFTNSAGGDYSLNNTLGGGMACRSVGYPGVINGQLAIGSRDIGAFQVGASAPVYIIQQVVNRYIESED